MESIGLHLQQYRMENKNNDIESIEHSVTPLAKETKQHCVRTPTLLHRFARQCNYNASDVWQWCLETVMEVLIDPNTHMIGVYGSHDQFKDTLLEKVRRRVHRDKLFDMVLTAIVTKRPDVKKIQEEIARQIGLSFNHKSKNERAQELVQRIKNEQKILIVLHDLHKELDLGKVGVPHGADHTGYKIILTSTHEDVLSNHMHTQKNFKI